MDKHIIGENAGILWRAMSQDCQRKWNLDELKEITGFNDMELASAIGWLAREDKIQFEFSNHQSKDTQSYVSLILNVYF